MKQTIADFWNGRRPLWEAFWILGFLLQIALGMFIFIALDMLGVTKDKATTEYILLLISPFAFIYSVFAYVSIWRCANNSKNIWKILARIWVLLGVLRSIFEIITFFTNTPTQTGV